MPKKKEKKGLSLHDFQQEAEKLQAPKSDKERQITDAAIMLMAERGIDGATTAEIARRADVTERTLFRYFPTKKDLVRRVMLPLLFRLGFAQQWEELGRLIKSQGGGFKELYATTSKARLAAVSMNPGLVRTALFELVQNDDFRATVTPMWMEYIWQPMLSQIERMKRDGEIRKDVDTEVLARAMQSVHVGYFLTRFFLAPNRAWDDAVQVDQMAELLARGASLEKKA
jgi:TetR/AcrR family transcriptional regulator